MSSARCFSGGKLHSTFYPKILSIFQHVSDPLLCASTWICTIAETDNVALLEYFHPAYLQLHDISDFRPKTVDLPHPVKLLCREPSPPSWTFHRRALSLGRAGTRDIFLLRYLEHSGVQCDFTSCQAENHADMPSQGWIP